MHCGYLIPKGAVIVPNIWLAFPLTMLSSLPLIITYRKFTHDPNIYRDPFAFKPERHLATAGRPAELDPRNIVFGFGRRYGILFYFMPSRAPAALLAYPALEKKSDDYCVLIESVPEESSPTPRCL